MPRGPKKRSPWEKRLELLAELPALILEGIGDYCFKLIKGLGWHEKGVKIKRH